MKKSLVALAAFAAVGAASAQSTVTLYGVVDVNIQDSKGSTKLTEMTSGGLNGSRWGLRGTEDLGGGLAGTFRLESGFNTDTGTSAQGGRLFGRHATVGLQGGFGSVRIGRTLTPIGVLSDESNSMGTKPLDILSVAGAYGATTAYRTDNSITYDSPNFGGFTFEGQYSLQRELAEVRSKVGRQFGFHALYKGGPIQAGIGYINERATAGGQDIKGLLFNAGYDFGVVAVKGVVNRDDRGTAEDPTVLAAEVSVPLGAFTGTVGFGRVKDSTGAANVSDNANIVTLQGVYNLSKRTALYTFYTNVSNSQFSRVGFRTPNLDQNSRAFQVGVRHSF